jgi:hypothetical protein
MVASVALAASRNLFGIDPPFLFNTKYSAKNHRSVSDFKITARDNSPRVAHFPTRSSEEGDGLVPDDGPIRARARRAARPPRRRHRADGGHRAGHRETRIEQSVDVRVQNAARSGSALTFGPRPVLGLSARARSSRPGEHGSALISKNEATAPEGGMRFRLQDARESRGPPLGTRTEKTIAPSLARLLPFHDANETIPSTVTRSRAIRGQTEHLRAPAREG